MGEDQGPVTAPFGTWPSPITAAVLVERTVSLSSLEADATGSLWWSERRPAEGGREALVRGGADVLPSRFSVRSRVHEYGGRAYTVGPEAACVVFSDDGDRRLWRLDLGGGGEPIPEKPLVDVEEQLTDDCVGEVAVGLLDEQQIGELALDATHGQVVLVSSLPFDLAGQRVQGTGDTEMVEGDVAQGDIELELGGVGDPLTEPLGHNHVVVGMGEQPGDLRIEVGHRCAVRRSADDALAHICPTSSGISYVVAWR